MFAVSKSRLIDGWSAPEIVAIYGFDSLDEANNFYAQHKDEGFTLDVLEISSPSEWIEED